MKIIIERGFEGKNEHNFTMVMVNGHAFYFFYETIVAFRDSGGYLRVCENIWGVTTGKHLNYLDRGDKKNRWSRDTFLKELSALQSKI